MEKLVWYVCYGSNLLEERFRCYITGETFRVNGVKYRGCTDKTPPRDKRAAILPCELYFAKKSSSWDGGGVAFLDKDKPSVVLGKMYLISEEQFREIHEQEGPWYKALLNFGEHGGYPVKSFTSEKRCAENPPSEKYRRVITAGMREMLEDKGIFKFPAVVLPAGRF
ncbi:MAG: hypothetical protein LBP43_03815 [Treponema sp.]|jgi:hypothetical protein|nr:hypothetical protein [Treponema sp.]